MSYTKDFPANKSLSIIGRIAETCSQRGGDLSKELYKLFLDGRYQCIVDFKFDYSGDFTCDDFLYARQIQALFNKREKLDLGIDKEKVAFTAFLEAEKRCEETNRRFRADLPNVSSDTHAVLHYASRKIDRILGDVPVLSELNFSFGPGATTSVNRARSNPRVKLEAPLSCSHEMMPHAVEFLAEFPLWMRSHGYPHGCNRISASHGKLTFVPKNSKTHRSIGVEPTLNGFGQQGIGKFIRHRLMRSGVDLTDQTRNQKLAYAGSKTGALATVDLSSASDTISYGLVLHLLPMDWFELLDRFRTGTVEYQGNIIRLSKFSSMGNSYTFELESLIFYALAIGVCTHLGLSLKDVSVYGDDIIIPVPAIPLLQEVLSVCGFSMNMEKSFWDGPFRESCGADYFNGIDIRPFYLKDEISNRVLFNMHNWFIRHCEPVLAGIVLASIPTDERLFGPDGYGDGHLIGSYCTRSSREFRRRGYAGGFFDTYVANSRRIKLPSESDWVHPLYTIYVRGDPTYQDPVQHDIVPGDENSMTYRRLSIYTLRTGVFT